MVAWRWKGELSNHLGGTVHRPVHQLVAVAHPPRIPFHFPAPTGGGHGHVGGDGVGPPDDDDGDDGDDSDDDKQS